MRYLTTLSFVIIPFWWIFLVIWQPAFVHVVAQSASPAIDRALEYATIGTNQTEDIYFTSDEISHLVDVARLYRPISLSLNILAVGAWSVLILAVAKKKKLRANFLFASKVLTGFLIILSTCLLFFSFFFEKFHMVLFPGGNWQFPADSMLITLFPEIFWQLMLAAILSHCALFAIIYWILGKER
jgi:uncharacterized membrane protein